MRKALLLARHEIVGVYSDRAALARSVLFIGLPIVLVFVNRRAASGAGPASDILILVFGALSALLPSTAAINAAAGSFAGEKEAQTLVPLLAAPIRDLDIVAGKLMAIVAPAFVLSCVSVTAFYVAATVQFGAERVGHILQPATLLAFLVLGVFFVLTLGSWVMVLSSRVNTQRGAQQIAGFITAGLFLVTTGLGSLLAQDIASNAVILVVGAVLVSDVVALELARRLWDREEAVARI